MMAETSPGNTPTTEQSALVIKYDHFGNQTKGKEVTSYPYAEVCINGICFRVRDSQTSCLSITYASLPGVKPTTLGWRMCCDPNDCVGAQYVTYHKLTDSDKSLSAVLAGYNKPNVVGLIIVNTTNSLFLSHEFVNKEENVSSSLPVYVVASNDGVKLKDFLFQNEHTTVEVIAKIESTVDSEYIFAEPPHRILPENKSRGKLESQESFNLSEELTKHLHFGKKEKRIIVCDPDNESQFLFIFSCFQNYEAQQKRDSHDKVIKLLAGVTDEVLSKDFLFYFLLGYRFVLHSEKYSHSDTISYYLRQCIMKFEGITNVQTIADVANQFLQRKDFEIQFNHGPHPNASVFQLMYDMSTVMLHRSNKLHNLKDKPVKYSSFIYHRMLWIALMIHFGLRLKEEPTKLASLWRSKLLNEMIQKELHCSDQIVQEFKKGFELLRALKLPESSCFDGTGIAVFLHPVYAKSLYVSQIMSILQAAETYFSQTSALLIQFLPPMRSNYQLLFNENYIEWKRFSASGTKHGVYKEALKYLEYIFGCLSKLHKDDQNDKMAYVIETEIKKWLELLVNSVDMFASDAGECFRILYSELSPKELSEKYRKNTVVVSIQNCGMEFVKKRFAVSQFYSLLTSLKIWRFKFVEEFLTNYNVPEDVNLTDEVWRSLLKEIIFRFPDAYCKSCIINLLNRIGRAYRHPVNFLIDLMKLNIPDLLQIHSPTEKDSNIEQSFINNLCLFIQRKALNELILYQIEDIMKLVKPGNHLQGLILAAIQKELILDAKMIKKLNCTPKLKHIVAVSIKATCNSLPTLPQLSEVEKFYWHFIALCCNYVQPNPENLDELCIIYEYVIVQLSKIFQTYCDLKQNTTKEIHQISYELSDISNIDVKDYFHWIQKMTKILTHWQEKFMDGEFNYDDIFTYANNLDMITVFAEAILIENFTYNADEINETKKGYSSLYGDLCLLLVKNSSDSGWCTLVEMLSSYGVRFSPAIQTMLDTHLILPGTNSVTIPKDVQQRLNQPYSDLELDPEMILIFRKTMTLNVLRKLFNELQLFLQPILPYLDFLVYFHLHDSEMFNKQLFCQMNKISGSQEGEGTSLTVNLTGDVDPSSTDHTAKLNEFASTLQQTKRFLLNLIGGTATFEEIFPEGSFEESLQKFDADREFKIICGFSEFQKHFDKNEEGKKGIKHMLELFQYSQQISQIPNVCEQYSLLKCLDDPELKELIKIIDSVKATEDVAHITAQIANSYMQKIREILKLSDSPVAKKCLKIFPAVANCAEFYQFIKEKGFANNRAAFSSQIQLITAQLQHEDYNENVLNHLMPAFQYITPFLDTEQNLSQLMNRILKLFKDDVYINHDLQRDFCQLETVNSNITMIQLWFSRTEGDTLENVSKELECILKTGHFKLNIMPKRLVSFMEMDNEIPEESTSVLLQFELAKEIYFQRQRERVSSESSNDTFSPPKIPVHIPYVSETWNNDQINDFVRKLGFLEAQSADVEQSVNYFQQMNQTAQKLYMTLMKLRDLGHPDYMKKEETISCSTKLELAESMVSDAEETLKEWKTTIKEMHKSYSKLLFFSVSKVLSLYTILKDSVFSADKMIQEIGFLFENSPTAIEMLKRAAEACFNAVEDTMPFASVGKYLDQLCNDASVAEYFLHGKNQTIAPKRKSSLKLLEMVHFVPNYDNGQLLRLIIHLYNGVPESYEMFHCDENSTEEDLKLFLNRASKFRYHVFTILGVNLLPYKLQELILHHHSQETNLALESTACLHYIETASSVLHEMPWVEVKEYKAKGLDLSWDDAKSICEQFINRENTNFDLELVYGLAGDGKTHYINKHLSRFPHHLIIAVNESFNPLNAILRLRSLPSNASCGVFFNFTITPSTNSEEEKRYKKLMDTLAWFFFKLLVFEYIEEPGSGMAFRLPAGHSWKIFVEVPSLMKVAQENAKQHLREIQKEIPIFKLIGKEHLIAKTSPYDIDASVQLVCKYLKAYENRRNLQLGINKLYKEKGNGKPVSFKDGPDIPYKQCYSLLEKYMPLHVTENKILQQLFIKYMERRCIFLENCPGFCYNTGCGVLDSSQFDQDELKEMKDHSMTVVSKGKYYTYTNTKKLGEVLMEIMFQEVSDFCKIDIQQNWTTQAHQQLIYEVRSGAGSIQLLTANSDKLDEAKTKKLKEVGIEIPSMKKLLDRKKLDAYLSSALDVPLKDGKLQDIDNENYVLTIDYTIKMLSIHERRECGIPVILEGETGVGKTALISMLSKLWNHALRDELRSLKDKIREMLLYKSLDLKSSNLRKILQREQDSTNWQFDKEMDATDKSLSEEELLPLTEMDHLSGSQTIPYYQFINERLLEMAESEIILELIDIDKDTNDDYNKYQNRKFNRKNTFVTYLTNNIMTKSSAQATARLLCTLLNGNLITTFYKLNIHAALSPKEIREFFTPIIKLADHLLGIFNKKQINGMEKLPVVTVFLDEVNTSSCMGLFKELIIDKTFEGEPIPSNIFLIAACNPHRGNSLAVHANKEHKLESWVRGSYYVQKLHPTMRLVMWDYGSLNAEQESHYIETKMVMVNNEFDIVQNIVFSEIVVKCQNLIRQFAMEQLVSCGMKESEAKVYATSCVSQRDIQRVFTFYCWISKTYKMMQETSRSGKRNRTTVTRGNTKHPKINKNSTPEQICHRALLVALGLVYYMRLDTLYRLQFADELDKNKFSMKFQTAFTEEMNFYTNQLSLPKGIAKTEALKENLFATIICTVTKTPLIIVGAPGSSKTLSFNLTISNLKGPESKEHFFRDTEMFKSLDPHYYQCSRRTTSIEIETVFQRAINRQRSHNSFSMPIRCVVFMDEAGLPEESHESLKALHYHLDQREVAFVAITNHVLDAAKTNRAMSLFRPTASKRDLEMLAKGCFCDNPEKMPREPKHDIDTILKLCDAYCDIMEEQCFKEFFGLRDFIHFINYIRRKREIGITPQLVLKSLERNFNGSKEFEKLCSVFLSKIGEKENGVRRSIIEILCKSLADKPYCNDSQGNLHRTGSKRKQKQSSPSHDSSQNEVRYKLIIDPSEDESITQLLFKFGILQRENTRTYMCSDFFGDGELQKINTIAAIRHSAIAGHTVVMNQTDDIHESFYDLFNQHFRRIEDPKAGPRYFTNIAIGAHLKPSRVDQNFQCIVVVKESEIKNTPAPFLNRFEKYYVSHENLLNLALEELPFCLEQMVNVIYKKVETFYELLDPSSFYGTKKETICSLMLSILPRPGQKYDKLSDSSLPTDSEVNSIVSVFTTNKSSFNKVLLLQNVVKYLHKFGGFYCMESSIEELEHDANSIIDLLTSTSAKFNGIAGQLENCDSIKILQWITEALNLIYDDSDRIETVRASDGACMVTAVIAQWLLRFMCKKLMHLLTPESAILNRKCIPTSYLETYLNYQAHFSIKDLIKNKTEILNQCEDNTNRNNEVATKIICYTRSTSVIHQLPATYPSSALSSAEELQVSNDLKNLICEKVDNLSLCKLSSFSSQTTFKLQLQAFVSSQQQTIFVLIVNMQETKSQIINHIRIMIEEVEHPNGKVKKLFVLLLHFPAMMFYDPCYPSLFLCGWDHYYIDTVDQASNSSLVNTKEWFKQSCLSPQQVSSSDDSILQSFLKLLDKQESIQIIASRILLNIDSNELHLDSLPDIATKVDYLKKLLFDKKIAYILCLKFKSYWTPSVMGHHLEQAARFSKSRESTLSISDSVDSICKSAFFNFIAYMLYQISTSCNFDVLLNDPTVLDLFLRLLEVHAIPKLPEVKAFNNTWDCRAHTANRTSYTPQFPFFLEVSAQICKMVETSMEETLQENENSIIDSRKLLKMLYDHTCDKVSIAIKGERTVGPKYMSAIAIKEMNNHDVLWQKYYNDFVCHYLYLSANPDDLEHKLLEITFSDIFNSYSEMKVIAAHCYIHLYQLDLGKILALLKSLGKLQIHKEGQESLCQEDPESSLITTLWSSKCLTNSSISKFVIQSLFAVLVDTMYSKDPSSRLCILQKWFKTYRDTMSIISLNNTLSGTLKDDCLKTKCHVMKATYLILLSFDDITSDSTECACVLASRLCNKFFNGKFEFKGKRALSIREIVTSFNEIIQSPQFIKLISIPHLYQKIMEDLFAHFFTDFTVMYSKEDIEFFIAFTNKQDTLRMPLHSDDQPQNLLNLSKFKICLDRILCKGWSESGAAADPLGFYKLEICICVGEAILSNCPEIIASGYIPLHLQQSTKENEDFIMQQTLMHLYFYAILERLQGYQYSPAELVKMIEKTDQKFIEADNNAEKVIKVVEKQALLETLIQAVVNHFDINDKSKLSNLVLVSDKLNLLIKDQSHCDILLMHLMKKYHGPQGVLNLLSDRYSNCWKSFSFFVLLKGKLKGFYPSSTSHQFPFISVNSSTKHQSIAMYKEICGHLCSISEESSTQKTKTFLRYVNSITKNKNKVHNIRPTVNMMIWLCVYYKFYCEKKTSTELIQFFEEVKDDLGLSEKHLNILNCFLNPTKMIKRVEAPNPQNLNAEALENINGEEKKKSKKVSSNKVESDPIWEFFNPDNSNFDPTEMDLRHALANIVAVVFALPSRSTHLWYHMLNPGDLENSYLTGCMYPRVVVKGGLMYDCGCALDEHGYYGRPDYESRDALSLHSWHLLLWSNFGAFCVALLTQPTAHEQIKGHLLSDWLSIRHYCMAQLRTVWSHIKHNMSLSDDERSFFIMRSMHQLFTLFQEKTNSQGKFTNLNALTDYETTWHKSIYEYAKTNLTKELENYSSNSIWALSLVKNFRILKQHYPHPVTEDDYIKFLVDATEANNCIHTHLFVVHQFTLKRKMLQLGGALLPDLVEFYQWLHIHLSYLVTYEKTTEISIGNVISLSAKRYPKEVCTNLANLIERIICKYNDYLRLNGGTVGGAGFNGTAKPANIHYISKNTPLIKLLSLEDQSQNDWLYIVLVDIIQNHNGFLKSILKHATSPACHYKMYLPDNPPELHPSEVTSQHSIIPCNETNGENFIKLIKSHYIYSGLNSIPMIDLDQLEQAVVKFYIAGKPLIINDGGIRSVFRFKNSPTEITLSGHNPGCATDLSAIAQELPNSYKEPLDGKERQILEYHFRTASYHTITEVVSGLRMVIGHLIQDILQRKDEAGKNIVLFDYLKRLFNQNRIHQVFGKIGIQSVNDMQHKLLGDLEIKKLFKCLELFVGWLQGGLYDFTTLPVSMFKHMDPKDTDTIMSLHTKYSSVKMDNLLIDLNEFEKSLNHAESHLIAKVDSTSSIVDILVNLDLCTFPERFVCLVPKSILACHYVYFRMTLRRLKIRVTEMAQSQSQGSSVKWNEIIEDLWEHLSHFKDKENLLLYDDNCLKLDCITLQYVDGQESTSSDSITWLHQNTSDMEDSLVETDEAVSEILQKFKENPELKKTVTETLVSSLPPAATVPADAPMSPDSLLTRLPPPSESAKKMTTKELCQWLQELKIPDGDVKCFEEEPVDGEVLAELDLEDLKELGIERSFIRKKIIIKFRPPSEKVAKMTTEELCQWLQNKVIVPNSDIECFKKEEIDGSLLAEFDHKDLEELGIKKNVTRKKIFTKFKHIS